MPLITIENLLRLHEQFLGSIRWLFIKHGPLCPRAKMEEMRLHCDVDIINRVLSVHNLKKAGKSSRAQVSIGKKPGNGPMKDDALFLMVCTAKDRNGTKYQIKDNIQQVFTKFVSEGKATIRFKEPEQDVCLSKVDVIQLKSFLGVLRLAVQGKSLDNVTLSTLAPASAKNVEKPKTSLVVTSRKDYPMTTNFPRSLEKLQVSECRMKRIDSRMYQLRNLITLDLSHNLIETVPTEIGQLQKLQELSLAHNCLTTLTPAVCLLKSLQSTLTSLNLSYNNIQRLPLQICELSSLISLKVDNNQLEDIPPTIGRLGKLLCVSLCNNKVKFLPASFLRLRLDNVDLFGNALNMAEDSELSANTVPLPTLLECAARTVRRERIPYSPEDLHLHLCRYLDSARQCWCGTYCFHASARYRVKVDLRTIASTVTAVDTTGGTGVPVEGFLCSMKCLQKFVTNPNAYWR